MKRINGKTGIGPAITLVVLAPLIAEVLSGATRFGALFVFPIEVCVWGGGALLIRYAVRKGRLGWPAMLLLALSLSIAEECLIQQTSLAPLVIRIKGVTYGRALGINYLYFLWALIYESVFVVLVPVALTELIFRRRKTELWVGRKGLILVVGLFLLGSYLAWYSWTQIARTRVFHVPLYTPPFLFVALAVILIGCLVFAAMGPFRNRLTRQPLPVSPPPAWLLGVAGGLWTILLYGVVLLAFGIAPSFPPLVAFISGCLLAGVALFLMSRWVVSADWQDKKLFSVIFGMLIGLMLTGFFDLIAAGPSPDLYFRILVVAVAVALLLRFSIRLNHRMPSLIRDPGGPG
jgi:hypothetical protein